MVMQSMLGSYNKNAGGGKHVGSVFFPSNGSSILHIITDDFMNVVLLDHHSLLLLLLSYFIPSYLQVYLTGTITEISVTLNSSQLVERIAIDEIAESMMAFNTNYKDTGLFGVYAAAEVR